MNSVVSLTVLMADAFVKITGICLSPLLVRYTDRLDCLPGFFKRSQTPSSYFRVQDSDYHDDDDDTNVAESIVDSRQECYHYAVDDMTAPKSVFSRTSYVLGIGFILSILVCILATQKVFGSKIPWYYVLLSVILFLPMAVIAIRSLGESDYNPQSDLGTSSCLCLFVSIFG